MKKIVIGLLFLAITTSAYSYELRGGNRIDLYSPYVDSTSLGTFNRMDAADDALGFSFYAMSTSPITDVDMFLNESGDITGQNFKIRIETDSGSNQPSGSILGAATSSFAGPGADGWVGLQTLGTNTGALTIGNKYWIIIYEDGTGSDPDGSNYLTLFNLKWHISNDEALFYTGASWTNDDNDSTQYALKHLDGSYSGNGFSDVRRQESTQSDIDGTNKQGIRLKFGSKVKIKALVTAFNTSGSPDDITATVYEEDTSRQSYTIPVEYVSDSVDKGALFLFTEDYTFPADTNINIVFTCSGCDSSNDYSLMGVDVNSTYAQASIPDDVEHIYGASATDPESMTVDTTFYPRISLPYTILSTDFDESAGGGTAVGSISVSTNF